MVARGARVLFPLRARRGPAWPGSLCFDTYRHGECHAPALVYAVILPLALVRLLAHFGKGPSCPRSPHGPNAPRNIARSITRKPQLGGHLEGQRNARCQVWRENLPRTCIHSMPLDVKLMTKDQDLSFQRGPRPER